MKRDRRILLVAWAVAGLMLVAAMIVVASGPPAAPDVRVVRRASPEPPRPVDTNAIALGARMLRDHNPFRLERRPADVRFDPWAPVETGVVATTPEPPRPTLTIVGLVGGPPWLALVEGIPGRRGGVLLAVGQESHGVRLTALRGDTVVLAGHDTTWVLTTRRVWQ